MAFDSDELRDELAQFRRDAESKEPVVTFGGWLSHFNEETQKMAQKNEPILLRQETEVTVDGAKVTLAAGTELSYATAEKLGLVGRETKKASQR